MAITSRIDQIDQFLFTVIERDGVEILRMPRSDFLKLIVVREAAEAIAYEEEVARQIALEDEEARRHKVVQ